MNTPKLPLHWILTALFAGSLAGCELPDIDGPDDDDEAGTDGGDGDGDGDGGGGGGGSKGLSGGGAADDGADDDGADDDGADDDGAADDGAADDSGGDEPADSGDLPGDAGEGCVSYCANELACDDFYDDAATCEAECAASGAEFGDCAPQSDAMYACVGALDCDGFAAYWAAVEMILNDIDPGPFPCAEELVALAECADANAGA